MANEILRALIGSFLGTVGFAALIHAPRPAVLPAGAIGAATYLTSWLLTVVGLSEPVSMFIGALIGSLAAQYMAKRKRIISTVFVLLSIVAAVPGLGLYHFMALLGEGKTSQAAGVGVSAMSVILMMALGIGCGSMIFRLLRRHAASRRKENPHA